jgi:hypothetical protein
LIVFIKQRKVRRGKFQSRFASSSLQRREYAASLYTTGVIQFFLFWALVYGVFQTYAMMSKQFPDSAWQVRMGLPVVMGAIAIVVARAFVRNLRQAIAMYKRPSPSSRDETAERSRDRSP